jgi:uncharacterized membrane protein
MPETPSTPQGTTGLAPNVAGALSYLLGPITGVLFLVLEKESRFVRFHAAQSIGVGLVLFAANIVVMLLGGILRYIPFLGFMISVALGMVLSLVSLVLWLYLMYRAWQGDEWEVPVIGAQVRSYLGGGTAVVPHD